MASPPLSTTLDQSVVGGELTKVDLPHMLLRVRTDESSIHFVLVLEYKSCVNWSCSAF
jgi:hypothetical protein